MIVTNLRSSSITTFKGCPMAWFLEYNLGWDGGSNKAAIKGTVVHAVLELLACIKKADQEGQKTITTDMGISRLKVKDYLSTTRLLDKLTCRLYDIHTKKYPQLKWKDVDQKDCIKWVCKTLDGWGGQFDPRSRNIIEPEMFFDIEIVKPWSAYKYTLPDGTKLQGFFSIKGTIDVVTELDKNTIEVVDYKSGRYRKDWNTGEEKTIEYIRNEIQPRMYHYVLGQKYPDKQVMVTMLYINAGGPFSVYYDHSDIAKTEKIIKKYYQEIKKAKPHCVKTWKCSKMCEYGKTDFSDTLVTPLIRDDRYLTKCAQMEYVLQHKTVEDAMKHMCCGELTKNLDRYNQG